MPSLGYATLKAEPAVVECPTVQSYARKLLDFGFDLMGLVFESPLQLWTLGVRFLSTSLMSRLPIIWKTAGIFVIFMIVNSVVFCFIRLTDILVKMLKVFKWVCKLALADLVIKSTKFLLNIWLIIPEKEEEEQVDGRKKKKAASAVLKSSSRLLKEIGEWLVKVERQELE